MGTYRGRRHLGCGRAKHAPLRLVLIKKSGSITCLLCGYQPVGGCVCHIDGEWRKPPGNPLVSRWVVRHEKEMPLGHITEHKHFAEI